MNNNNDFEETVKTAQTEESFADLLESSLSGITSLKPGQLIETEIVSISGDCVFLQLSGKSEGQLDIAEFTDKDGNITVNEGDKIKAFFLYSKNGDMHFTTRLSGDKAGKDLLANAFENGIPIEGMVEKEIKGGYEIKIGDSRAFCPFSQMGEKRVENADQYIGRNLTFKIIEYKENGRNILVSNRAILQDDKNAQIEILKKRLHEDMVVKGTVKSLQDFGAFVDIEGVQALLPISEIKRSRVDDINKALSVGEEIEAEIIKLDWKNERITLSMKKLLSDPWDEADKKYKTGTRHTGEVVRITNFGAFVSLEPGLDGLIHISDLESDSRDNPSRKVLKKGDSVTVQINNIDIDKKRISLKPASKTMDDKDLKKYMENDSESYNPFASLLKGKMDK
ncbi:MAG: S1 RNA-binding domain-containing protein [Spirochaetia bacterium]|jgi:small subunit ribosomal protein S1|nr:S1 RNA-binding domain-containing protein [Spirochaetia bacterium]